MKKIVKYCTGCGLCSMGKEDDKGFYRPVDKDVSFDYSVCPYFTMPLLLQPYVNDNSIWGSCEAVYWGHSTNADVRFRASSGGVLTTVSQYLLENHIVDKIIQIGKNSNNALRNEVYCSETIEQVKERSGSRYCATALLKEFDKIIDDNYTYAVVGKPCDIIVVRNLMNKDERYRNKIKYLLSFFCGGTSSTRATENMVRDFGVELEKVTNIEYRGNGWPGKVQVTSELGTFEMAYEESWQKFLGRDMMLMCRFCWDGLGMGADITCGDAWYLKDKEPDFSEHEGRNVVFARNKKGLQLLEDCAREKKIFLERLQENDLKTMKLIQNGQYNRKATMFAKVLTMKLLGQSVPDYNLRHLLTYAKLMPLKRNISTALGTFRRVLDKKI